MSHELQQSPAQQNKLLLQQIFDAVSRGDPTLFYERFADDAKLIITGEYSRTGASSK